MMRMNQPICIALLGAIVALPLAARAETTTTRETTTTTTTTSESGTVSALTPGTIVVLNGTVPMTYAYTTTTTYVDEDGNPVAVETLKPGVPVTVFYTTSTTGPVVTKIVVKKTVGDRFHPRTVIEEKKTLTTP